MEYLQHETIDILFQGIETKALKMKYKNNLPDVLIGKRNIIIVYYIVEKVRERYVTCVLGQYTEDVNTKYLTLFFNDVFKIKE
ncbi:MAG TPA: hypothetical protein PK006_07665 [Saprospiraceae bacterium]|nr:hypothetical protein [Saprospiraceae bacterium]